MVDIIIREPVPKKEIVRIWEIDTIAYPNRTDREWCELILALKNGKGIEQVREKENTVCNAGMNSWAALQAGTLSAGQDGLIHTQALGVSSNNAAAKTDTMLNREWYRKPVSLKSASARVLTVSTVFNIAEGDWPPFATTVASSPSCTSTVVYLMGDQHQFFVGDTVQVQTPMGYAYVKVTANGSSPTHNITVTPALPATPVAGSTVNLVIDEAGMFGDTSQTLMVYDSTQNVYSNPGQAQQGTALNEVVQSSGTTKFTQAVVGDYIRGVPSDNVNGRTEAQQWNQVTSINNDADLFCTNNLATNYGTGGCVIVGDYKFLGTMFNHVTGLQYVRNPQRGYITQNQWTLNS